MALRGEVGQQEQWGDVSEVAKSSSLNNPFGCFAHLAPIKPLLCAMERPYICSEVTSSGTTWRTEGRRFRGTTSRWRVPSESSHFYKANHPGGKSVAESYCCVVQVGIYARQEMPAVQRHPCHCRSFPWDGERDNQRRRASGHS